MIEAGSGTSRRLARADGILAGRSRPSARARRVLVLLAAGLGLGCGADAPPWSLSGAAPTRTLPIELDLRDPEEARSWHLGPGVARRAWGAEGLRLEPILGARRGFHVARRLPLEADRLGEVEVITAQPARDLSVTVYAGGRARTGQTIRTERDPDDPRRHTAWFRRGTWNRLPVDGLRIEAPAEAGPIELSRVRVSSRRYPDVAAPDPNADWGAAFRSGTAARNVVLIVADTLRADRLSLYGHPRPTSPRLDALAAHGTVFDVAWSQDTCTFPSVNSLLTSQTAASFLGEPKRARRSLADRGGIAERLARLGWQTWAVSASWVVRATESPHNDWGGGYAAGFAHFDESCADEAAGCVNLRAIERIDAARDPGRPFFLYLHYMDPHDPYRPPPRHRDASTDAFTGRASTARGDPNPLVRILRADPTAGPDLAPDLDHLAARYEEEIRYLDGQLHLLFEALRVRGLLRETLVVLASDHGEAFLEHGELKHCGAPFEEQVRTPLVIWSPEHAPGRRIRQPVENLDIVPTILDLLDIAPAAPALEGRSLRAALELGQETADLAFTSHGAWQGVTDGAFKWLERSSDDRGRLFDLRHDPGETRDRQADYPAIRERLETAARRRFDEAASREREGAWEEVARQLRALGYLP